MLLTKAQITSVNDAAYLTVPIPDWGGEVRIRSLYGDQRTRLRNDGEKAASWDGLVCAMGIVDEQGNQLFTEAETTVLAKKHPAVLDMLARKILELSTMTKEARAEAEKKLQTTPTSDSGTSSPEPSTPGTDSTLTP